MNNKEVRNMSVGLGTAIGYLKLDVSGFASGVDSAISDMNRLNGNFSTASQGLQTIGGMFTKTGAALTAGFTAPVVGFGAASVKAGTEFDASMSQVAAVSKATGDDLKTIRDRAIEMGEKTRYTATEVSDAMYYMGLAGWDATQIYKGIPGVLALGAASGENLSRVSDIVTDSLTAFGKSAEDTTEFVNVLAEASRSSNTTVDMLGESFKYVGPVAGAFGYSIQDVATVLGIFANNGVKGSQAGTGLRQALNALINPSDKAAALMDQYGVSLFNADGSTKSLMTVCEELRGTFGGLSVDIHDANGEVMSGEEIMEKYGHSLPSTEMEKLSAIVKIFGVRALPGMLSVINAADDDFYGLAEAINGAQDAYDGLGTAFGMQETMLDNLQGDWYLFTSALGTTKILISDMAKGALRELVQGLTNLVNKFNEMDPAQREQIVKWALIAASIGPVLVAIGKIISGIGSLITTFNTLKGAFTFVSTGIKHFGEAFSLARAGLTGFASQTNVLGAALGGLSAPIIAIIALIVALVAAFVNLWKNNEEFRNKIIGIWEEVKAKFEEAGQRIVEIFNELGFSFEDFQELLQAGIEVLKTIWDGFCELLAPIFVGTIDLIANAVKGIVDLFVGIIEVVVGIIKGFKDGDWTMFWQGLKDIVMAFVNGIVGVFDILGETIWNFVQTVANWFGADWNMTWDEAKQSVKDWFDSVVQWVTELPSKIATFFSNLWSTIKGFFSSVGAWIMSIPEKIGNLVSTIGEAISTFISNVIQWFSALPGKIAEFFTNIWNSAIEWGSNMIAKAIEVGTNFLNNVVQFFAELPNKIAYFIGYALGTVIKWVINMVNKAREMGTNFLQAVVDFFTQLPGNILNFITSAWNNVVQWSVNMVNKAREMSQNFLNHIVSFFTQLPGRILGFITSAWNHVQQWATNMVNKAREMAQNFLNNIVSFFTQLPGKILNFITSVWNNVVAWATNMVNKAREMAQGFLNNVVSFFTQLPGKIQGFLNSVINNVIRWVSDMKNKATEAAQGFFNNIVSGLSSLPSKMAEIGSNIVSGIWNGISSGWDWLKDKVASLAQSLLQDAKDALGIESPSKEFRDQVGRWIPPGIGEGFAAAMPALIKDMQNEIDDGVNSLSTDGANLDVPVEDFADAYRQVFEGLVVWFETMEERMAVAVESLSDYFKYLMYVRQIIGNDDEFRAFILGDSDGDRKPKNPTDDVPKNPTSNGGGDTFVFYSNEPIDEIQAARLLRETKRDMAEGF